MDSERLKVSFNLLFSQHYHILSSLDLLIIKSLLRI